MIKTASETVHKKIRRARAVIAAGVRLKQPQREATGRAAYAEAVIENQVLLYGENLTSQARSRLARLLFDSTSDTSTQAALDADEDATADAEETTAELLQEVRKINAPIDMVRPSELDPETLYDPDNEEEWEEEDPIV